MKEISVLLLGAIIIPISQARKLKHREKPARHHKEGSGFKVSKFQSSS